MHTTTWNIGRRAFGLTVLGALALSACGSDPAAGFEDGGGSDASDGGGASTPDAAAELPRLEVGFTVEEFTKDVTVSATLQPKNSTVITPTGHLSIDGVQEIATVSADSVGLEAEFDENGEALDFAPADGEVLRAFDLTFTPSGDDAGALAGPAPLTDLSLRAGGSQTHLAEIDGQYSNRILVSVPKDVSAFLVVGSEGHDQLVDLLTGERQPDDIAAAYYRGGRLQEPHHTFPVPVDPFPVLYSGTADSEIVATPSFQATDLELTAWTAETGWAAPGSAWLVVNWRSEITVDTSIPGLVEATGYSATASVTVDGEKTTDEAHLDDLSLNASKNAQERTIVAAVPVGTSAATLSMSGGFSVAVDSDVYEITGEGDRTYTSEELTVDFPDGADAPAPAPSDGGDS